jgi:hypothetical protein
VFVATLLPLPGPVMAALTLGSGWPLIKRAGRTLARDGRLNVEVLDAATLVVLAIRGNYRAAALLVWLLSAGQYVLDSTVVRIRRSIRDLLASPADPVWREADGGRTQVPIGAVRAGDTIVLAAGERVPVDGTVVHGEALIDQQRVTGEGLPVERVAGDRVYASTMVEDGEIAVRVDRVGIETSVGRIIEAAEGEKPELQLFAEELADRLVFQTVGLAALASAVTRNLDTGIAILVAVTRRRRSCPGTRSSASRATARCCRRRRSARTARRSRATGQGRRRPAWRSSRWPRASSCTRSPAARRIGPRAPGPPSESRAARRRGWHRGPPGRGGRRPAAPASPGYRAPRTGRLGPVAAGAALPLLVTEVTKALRTEPASTAGPTRRRP